MLNNFESKKKNIDDKLKNTFIKKIYDLETKLNEKDNIIIHLSNEIENLKAKNKRLEENNLKRNNSIENLNYENKSEESNNSNESIRKNPINSFVKIERNSIFSSNKLINNKNNHLKEFICRIDSNCEFDKNTKEYFDTEIKTNSKNEKNKLPKLYQRKKNNILNEDFKSKSFCYEVNNNISISELELNLFNFNDIDTVSSKKNTIFNTKNNNSINEFNLNSKNNVSQDQNEQYRLLTFETNRIKIEDIKTSNDIENNNLETANTKLRKMNISLSDFNELNLKNDIKNLNSFNENEMKNNGYADNHEICYIENESNHNKYNGIRDNIDHLYIDKIENNTNDGNNTPDERRGKNKEKEITNKRKESILSPSSYDYSHDSSLNNILQICNKSKGLKENEDKNDKRKVSLLNKKITFDTDKIDLEDIDKLKKSNGKNFSFKFPYLNLLRNKHPKKFKLEGNDNNHYEKENICKIFENPDIDNKINSNDIEQNQNISNNQIDNSDKSNINICKNINMNLIIEESKGFNNFNNSYNLISNSPIHQNIDSINNLLNKIKYSSFKINLNNQNDIEHPLKIDSIKGEYGVNKNILNKSNSVDVKKRTKRDHNNYDNYNNANLKQEKYFAEDYFLINSEQDINTEPANNDTNEKFYKEKLAFDINIENILKRKSLETSRNIKITNKFLKETLFKFDEELVNLNSDDNNYNNCIISSNIIDKLPENPEENICETKDDLNFSFNNSKNNININKRDLSFNNDSFVNNEESKINKNKNVKPAKKIFVVKNEKSYTTIKKNFNDSKQLDIKNKEKNKINYNNLIDKEFYKKNLNDKNFNQLNKIRDKDSKNIKLNNSYLNKNLSIEGKNYLVSKESAENSEIKAKNLINSAVKTRKNSNNINSLNEKIVEKLQKKNSKELKPNLEKKNCINNGISVNKNSSKNFLIDNHNKFGKKNLKDSEISSVKVHNQYEITLSQNRKNLHQQNKNLMKNLNLNIKKYQIPNSENKKDYNYKDSIDNKDDKNFSKKNKFSRSNCDLKNEIYLNINKEGLFSLKPDEVLNISDSEFVTNKIGSADNSKENCENVFSLENDKTTPSGKKSKKINNESSINKISEVLNFNAESSYFNNLTNKFTLSHKNLLMENNENIDGNNYSSKEFDKSNLEEKKLSVRSKSSVDFDKFNYNCINNKCNESGMSYCEKYKKEKLNNEKGNNFINKISDQSKNKIEILTMNKSKNFHFLYEISL